jgi:hypothetical protein
MEAPAAANGWTDGEVAPPSLGQFPGETLDGLLQSPVLVFGLSQGVECVGESVRVDDTRASSTATVCSMAALCVASTAARLSASPRAHRTLTDFTDVKAKSYPATPAGRVTPSGPVRNPCPRAVPSPGRRRGRTAQTWRRHHNRPRCGPDAAGEPAEPSPEPLAAPVIAATRVRKESANSARGAAGLVTDALVAAKAAGASGLFTVRADSAFFAHDGSPPPAAARPGSRSPPGPIPRSRQRSRGSTRRRGSRSTTRTRSGTRTSNG